MREELKAKIERRSDVELYEMLYLRRNEWTPEALEVAEEVWGERNLDAATFEQAKLQAEEANEQKEAIRDEPLSTRASVLFFLFNLLWCLGIPQIIIADTLYKSRGYERKWRQAIAMMVFGFVCFMLLGWLCHFIVRIAFPS